MQSNPSLSIQELKQLFTITYQGSSTESIQNAFSKLIQISLASYNQFLGLCETILETEQKNKSLCMSVANFIKVLTKKAVDQKYIDQCGPKNFINRIEHIFDNSKISPTFKESIAISFIKAALHFRMNFQKIIQKILYLYNVKDHQQAIYLSRACIQCDLCLDPKIQGLYYKKILPAEMKYLCFQIKSYKNFIENGNNFNEVEKMQEMQVKIKGVVRNIHSSLTSIPFQKFESSIFACLQKDDLIETINSIDLLRKNMQIMILIWELIQKIVDNLYRMHRIQKMPNLMKAISEHIHQQWNILQNVLLKRKSCLSSQSRSIQSQMEPQQQLSLINLLTTGFSCHIIKIIDENIDIWNLFILPLYETKLSILNKNKENIKQAFLLIQDSTFMMKSQCLQVSFNKLIKTILENYQFISSKITFQVDAILLSQIHNQLNPNDQNKLLMLINFITFQASYFLTQDSFISKIQNFLISNSQQLFNSQNQQIYFQSLILLYHYIEDVFCQYLCSDIFENITNNFIKHTKDKNSLNKNQVNPVLSFLAEIQRMILTSFFSAGFSQKQIQRPSQIIINFLSDFFDGESLKVFTCLIKYYKIEDRITLQVLDKVLEEINSLVLIQKIDFEIIHEELSAFIQFLVTFFDLDQYKHLFQSTLARILPIFEHMIGNKNQFEDDFFIMIKNFTAHLEYVPQNYLQWMGNIYNHRIMQTQEGFKSLAVILQNLSPSKYNKDNLKYELFVNCIALNLIQILVTCNHPSNSQKNKSSQLSSSKSQENLYSFFSNEKKNKSFSKKQILSLLCLHQLIHFHSQYLTRKILHHIVSFALTKIIVQSRNHGNENQKSEFTYQNGKYQLIFILLFKRRLYDTNQILIHKGLQKKVYDAIYMKENHYLLEYDTSLFIKSQTQIIRKSIQHDKLQMAYANTSFLAVFSKFSTIFQMKTKNKGKCTLFDFQSDESDDQDFETQSQLRTTYKQLTKIVLEFPLPKQWKEIDELKEMRELILQLRQNSSSREWLEILYEKCLNKDHKKVMQELMKNLETINGKIRHIVKVNRNKLTKQSSSQQNQEFEI